MAKAKKPEVPAVIEARDVRGEITLDKPASLADEAKLLQQEFQTAAVTDIETYREVVKNIQRGKTLITRIVEYHAEMKKKSYDLWKTICGAESSLTRPIEDGIGDAKDLLQEYDDEQDRIRLAEQDRIRREAEEAEQKRREKEAKKLEKKGDAEAAAEVRAAPVEVPLITLPEAPKVDDVSTREVWGAFEILDPALIPREFLMPDDKKLKKYGQAMKGDAKVAGVRFYSVKQKAIAAE